MPGPVIRRPQDLGGVAGWFARKADPANESVTDSTLTNAIQMLARALSADDPAGQMMGMATTGIPSAGKAGGLVGAIQRKLHPSGFYSRLDEAVPMVPEKGVPAPGVLNRLRNAPGGVAQEEVDYRKLAELLTSKGNQPVTRAELQAWLEAHPAPFPQVKTLQQTPDNIVAWLERNNQGIPQTPDEWTRLSEQMERTAQGWQRAGDADTANRWFGFAEDAGRHAEGVSTETGSVAGQPKFSKYQVPGGENYRETLNTLPTTKRALTAAERKEMTGLGLLGKLSKAQKARYDELNRIEMAPTTDFRSSHFDEPNILVHTRANDRALPTGERGRFLEEVQSDWHQKGKKHGYQSNELLREGHNLDYWTQRTDALFNEIGKREGARAEWKIAKEHRNALAHSPDAVPDAPFKETWPDLGLKQQLIETANDPKAEWLGVTGGKTQAARYDLSKQVDYIDYRRTSDGRFKLGVVGKDGDGIALPKTEFTAEELPNVVGKEVADKIVSGQGQPGGGRMTLRGVDLQVGGEGMHKFYDELVPKRLGKIVKPFGGSVERGSLGRTKAQIDAEMDALHDAPAWTENLRDQLNTLQTQRNAAPDDANAWIARLSPQMKERIKREGLPLLAAIAMLKGSIKPEPSHEVFK